MEIWKNINGHNNYEVSSIGNVRRKKGETIYKDGRVAKFSQTVLKQSIDRKGYLRVYLSSESKKQTIRIHKLVAIAFLNHTPCGMDLVVDHIDEDKTNNYANNLQILTNRENIIKSYNSENKLNIHKVRKKNISYFKNLSYKKDRLEKKLFVKQKTSQYTGVCYDKSRNKWSAEIRIGKTRKRLGRFVNEIDAHNAYQKELNGL